MGPRGRHRVQLFLDEILIPLDFFAIFQSAGSFHPAPFQKIRVEKSKPWPAWQIAETLFYGRISAGGMRRKHQEGIDRAAPALRSLLFGVAAVAVLPELPSF